MAQTHREAASAFLLRAVALARYSSVGTSKNFPAVNSCGRSV